MSLDDEVVKARSGIIKYKDGDVSHKRAREGASTTFLTLGVHFLKHRTLDRFALKHFPKYKGGSVFWEDHSKKLWNPRDVLMLQAYAGSERAMESLMYEANDIAKRKNLSYLGMIGLGENKKIAEEYGFKSSENKMAPLYVKEVE